MLRKLLKFLPRRYEDPRSFRQAFPRMGFIQRHVVADMAARGLLQMDSYNNGILVPTDALEARCLMHEIGESWANGNAELTALTISTLMGIPLKGKDGLKDRTRLLEYRYDN